MALVLAPRLVALVPLWEVQDKVLLLEVQVLLVALLLALVIPLEQVFQLILELICP